MDYIIWLLIGIILYLAIGYTFVCLMDMYENGFWEQVSVMLLWPILVILFCICCIYFGCEELYKKVKKNMKKIAITPHITRGEEVIKILESLGGVNADEHKGNLPIEWESAYYIYGDCTIQFAKIEYLEKLNYEIYTIEEYEQREL